MVDKACRLRAFVITFDTIFGGLGIEDVVLTTAVEAPLTHWQHLALWLLPSNITSVTSENEIRGEVSYSRESDNKDDPRSREYFINLRWRIFHRTEADRISEEYQQSFLLH